MTRQIFIPYLPYFGIRCQLLYQINDPLSIFLQSGLPRPLKTLLSHVNCITPEAAE